ncbi:MAG TPA: HAMP domain-containing protein, partial [Patescibacteria group bacterium]|nr:HAMP domain-containing protein [Patescibacteria group bacterium]
MRISVKLKLAAAFGVIILLLVVSAVLAINGIGDLNAVADRLANLGSQRVKLAEEADITLGKIIRAEKNIILETTDDGIAKYDALLVAERVNEKAVVDKLRDISSEEGRRKLDSYVASLEHLYTAEDKIRAYGKMNSTPKATAKSEEGQVARDAANAALKPLIDRVEQAGGKLPADKVYIGLIAQKIIWSNAVVLRAERDSIAESTDAGTEKGLAEAAAAYETSRKLRDVLAGLVGSDDRHAVEVFSDNFDKWAKIRDVVAVFDRQNSAAHAFDISTTEARAAINQADEQAKDIVTNAETFMKGETDNATTTYQTIRTQLMVMVGVSILIALSAATFIAVSLSRGLGKAVELANAVAIGDLGQKIDVSSNDEVKDLVNALNGMTANLNASAKVAEEIAKGNLTVQAKRLSDKDTL